MKILNKVPKKFEKVLKNDNYKKNTKYSVTQLLKEPRAVVLESRYSDKVEYEIEDRLWSFFGTAFHNAMETEDFLKDNSSIIEERLKYSKVSGKFDHYDTETKTLYDFKFTSFWKLVYATEESMKDYQIQLSIYSWLLKQAGFEVENIANVLIFRDWKKTNADKVPKPYATVYHDVLTEIDGLSINKWIDNKIELFDKYMKVEDNQLPYCSEEFRWAEQDKFAVMKNKNKTATRVLETQEEAERYIKKIKDTKNKYWIQERKGNKFKRCEYCSIAQYCNQYKKGEK
ncbi:MAG: hypothetical protein PWP15_1145 [Methanothermococcus sp.]|uniref:hypothetical protein n=1 Tax=Methanothermococcus sp. TaxID=2614238 RepID=UPI0025833061|nr:hypothetical protein [Methanothermococcus sp.]MDK2790638.1 hypothetical protein [Methanothermococcus sp.]